MSDVQRSKVGFGGVVSAGISYGVESGNPHTCTICSKPLFDGYTPPDPPVCGPVCYEIIIAKAKASTPRIEMVVHDKRIGSVWPAPAYATPGSAALDLQACIDQPLEVVPGRAARIWLGVAVHIHDPTIAALIIPRSGLGSKGLRLVNGTGLIDSDFQGQLSAELESSYRPITIEPGQRILQMLFIPIHRPLLQVVEQFTQTTTRGANGFGSTG